MIRNGIYEAPGSQTSSKGQTLLIASAFYPGYSPGAGGRGLLCCAESVRWLDMKKWLQRVPASPSSVSAGGDQRSRPAGAALGTPALTRSLTREIFHLCFVDKVALSSTGKSISPRSGSQEVGPHGCFLRERHFCRYESRR